MATATARPAVPRRRNADQWRTLLHRFQQSSLGPKDFCRRENLAQSSFHRWRSKLATTTPAPGFVELLPPTSCPDDGSSSWVVELDLPGGGSLRIRCSR
jgi:hypothetical protein